jgi:GNAT superfamily N-acetyltransferase
VSLLRTALTDSRVREGLVLAGRQVVDGLGAWRVVRTWEQAHRLSRSAAPSGLSAQGPSKGHEPSGRLTARRADMDDARLLWEWHNDPGARAGSRNADIVPWPQHLAWLESSLRREDRILLVVEDIVGPVGTVRWDLEGLGEWEVSIAVAPQRRGQLLARPLLHAAEAALSEVAHSSGTKLTAYLAVVHVDNAGSVRLFETSAYVPDLPPDPRGFMRFRKVAPVALRSMSRPWECA